MEIFDLARNKKFMDDKNKRKTVDYTMMAPEQSYGTNFLARAVFGDATFMKFTHAGAGSSTDQVIWTLPLGAGSGKTPSRIHLRGMMVLRSPSLGKISGCQFWLRESGTDAWFEMTPRMSIGGGSNQATHYIDRWGFFDSWNGGSEFIPKKPYEIKYEMWGANSTGETVYALVHEDFKISIVYEEDL